MNDPAPTDTDPISGQHPNQSAMQDADMAARLEENPEDADTKLDVGLDESMDASDTPTALQPGDTGEPLPSSGYDEAAEANLNAP